MCCHFDIAQQIQPVLKLEKFSYNDPWKHLAELFEVFLVEFNPLPLKVQSPGCEGSGLLVRKGGKRGCILLDDRDTLIIEFGYIRLILAIDGPEGGGILLGELHDMRDNVGPIGTEVCSK